MKNILIIILAITCIWLWNKPAKTITIKEECKQENILQDLPAVPPIEDIRNIVINEEGI